MRGCTCVVGRVTSLTWWWLAAGQCANVRQDWPGACGCHPCFRHRISSLDGIARHMPACLACHCRRRDAVFPVPHCAYKLECLPVCSWLTLCAAVQNVGLDRHVRHDCHSQHSLRVGTILDAKWHFGPSTSTTQRPSITAESSTCHIVSTARA